MSELNEWFEVTPEQAARLSEEDYQAATAVTLNRLAEVENEASSLDPESIPEEQAKLELQLKQATEELIEGDTVEAWELSVSDLVASGLMLSLLIGFGGLERLRQLPESRTAIGLTVDLIKGQMRAIRSNANNIVAGISLKKLRDISRRRALSFRSGYEVSRLTNSMAVQFHNEAIRLLGPTHDHCPDCPTYEQPEWVPISEIVPVATACVCQSNCKCIVRTRFNPARVLQDLQGGLLFNQVQRKRDFLQSIEKDYLSRHGWL